MDCPHIPELSYTEFGKRLREKIGNQRIPISGSMELTFRCNLRCVHCYLDGLHEGIPGQQELSYQEFCGIIDQIVDEGCLWLLLTGGEPFVRPDALDIYTYAKRKGLIVTLFTNGTLITPQIADYLAEWRPFKVEITLYGRTQQTYERITGIPGSHARCMQGIDLLLERGVPLMLKTMLMTLNKHELWDIKAYAESLGVDFRFDPMLNAGVNGTRKPISYRLSPEEIVQFDVADPKRLSDWLDLYRRFRDVHVDPRHLYTCGAGLNSFHIDPFGKLNICMMSRTPACDLHKIDFRSGWGEFLRQIRLQSPTEHYRCNQCELLTLCGQCPGWAQVEHANPEEPVEFLCSVAHLRAVAFEQQSLITK